MNVNAPETISKPRLLYFFDARDGRSRRVEGFLAQVLQRRSNHDTFNLIRVDVSARPEVAERFAVTATPAIYVVEQKKVVARAFQPRGCKELQHLLQPWLQ